MIQSTKEIEHPIPPLILLVRTKPDSEQLSENLDHRDRNWTNQLEFVATARQFGRVVVVVALDVIRRRCREIVRDD